MEPICFPQFDAARAVKACGYPKAPYFNAKLTVSEGVCSQVVRCTKGRIAGCDYKGLTR